MKTINKYFYLLAAAALVGIVSCEKEKEAYAPGTPDSETCEGVYFIKQDVIEETQIFDPTQDKKAEIIVHRSNSVGALTITPKVTLSEITKDGPVDSDASLFTVSDIVFEDGQDESKIQLEFPNVKEGVQYSLHLKIEGDQYASKYTSSLIACDYNVMCVKYEDFLNPVTKKPAVITFKQGSWNEVHTGNLKYYEVDGVRYCQTYNEKLVGTPGVDGGGDGGFWGQDKDVHFEFLWYVSGEEECTCDDAPHSYVIPTGKVEGVPAGAQMIRVLPKGIVDYGDPYKLYPYDYYSYYVDKNAYARGFSHFISANDLYDSVSYYDLNGGFYFWIFGYTAASVGWVGAWVYDYDIVGIADGFTRADYTLELTAGVTEKDAEGNNVVPISFKLGSDSDLVGYSILPGKATGSAITAEVAAITKETEAMAKEKDAWLNDNVDFSKYNSTWVLASGKSFKDSVAPEDGETGFFTVVAVAVDTIQVRTEGKVTEIKLEVKNEANLNFQYINTGETNPVILSVAAGSTEKYISRGYDPTSSLEYTISGAGLTGVVPIIYDAASLKDGIEAEVEAMKADPNYFYSILGDKEYADYYLSDAALADVNDKGYSDIQTGLKANTNYYVVVWATNGYDCDVQYAEYTTPGLPNEIIKKGTGTYTYTLFFTDYDAATDTDYPVDQNEMNLEYNPNTEMFEIPHWGYNQTLSFSVDDDNNISVPLQWTGYTHSTYGDVYITDFSHLDEYCGSGFCEHYGLDPNQKGVIEDGVYYFLVAYAVKAGTFGRGYEAFYPDGKPVDEVMVVPALAPMSLNGLSMVKGVSLDKKTNNFVKIAGVKGLQPVVSAKEVAFNHNVNLCSTKSVVEKSNFVPCQSPVNSLNR